MRWHKFKYTNSCATKESLRVCVCYLSHKDAVFLGGPGLVPHSQLQHVVAEIPAMDLSVDEGLVPLGLAGLLHSFCPSFALVTA